VLNVNPAQWPTDDPDKEIGAKREETFWARSVRDPEERCRQILWLRDRGELKQWERQDIIEQARSTLNPPNPYWGPSRRERQVPKRLLEALT
jgi:hypothetical protein